MMGLVKVPMDLVGWSDFLVLEVRSKTIVTVDGRSQLLGNHHIVRNLKGRMGPIVGQ